MSIYCSSTGRQALEKIYTDAVKKRDVEVDERYVETRHGETHVLLTGPENGRPVVVFHGGNATNPLTLEWYTALTEEYRLIAPDTISQPGYGAETRVDLSEDDYGEWVVDLLDAFEVQAASMVGTSYGRGIVLRTAAIAPEKRQSCTGRSGRIRDWVAHSGDEGRSSGDTVSLPWIRMAVRSGSYGDAHSTRT